MELDEVTRYMAAHVRAQWRPLAKQEPQYQCAASNVTVVVNPWAAHPIDAGIVR